jgi:hypothetical protein
VPGSGASRAPCYRPRAGRCTALGCSTCVGTGASTEQAVGLFLFGLFLFSRFFFWRKSLDTYLRVLKPDCGPPGPGPIGNTLATRSYVGCVLQARRAESPSTAHAHVDLISTSHFPHRDLPPSVLTSFRGGKSRRASRGFPFWQIADRGVGRAASPPAARCAHAVLADHNLAITYYITVHYARRPRARSVGLGLGV